MMAEFLRENSTKIRSKATVFTNGLMGQFTMVGGKKASKMD